MTEMERFRKLAKDQYDGEPWLDVTFIKTLQDVSAETAAAKVGTMNSIWQIVNHVIAWRETLLTRLGGEHIEAPADNFFAPLTDGSSAAWTETLARLELSQDRLLLFLDPRGRVNMDEFVNKGKYSRFELLSAVLQHDAYHLGQIVLLKKWIGTQSIPSRDARRSV